jgi:hypothetical protein
MSVITQKVAPDTQLQRVAGRARKATPGVFGAGQDLASIRKAIKEELARAMRSDARLAAMIIVAEPERIGHKPVGDFLLGTIKCVEFETVQGWLQDAGVNPWRTGYQLAPEHRGALACRLIEFWKSDADL